MLIHDGYGKLEVVVREGRVIRVVRHVEENVTGGLTNSREVSTM